MNSEQTASGSMQYTELGKLHDITWEMPSRDLENWNESEKAKRRRFLTRGERARKKIQWGTKNRKSEQMIEWLRDDCLWKKCKC